MYQRIEQLIGKKLPLHATVEEEVMSLMERVSEAQRHAKMVRKTKTFRRAWEQGYSVDIIEIFKSWPFFCLQELQTVLDRKRGMADVAGEGEGPSSGKPRAKKRRKNKPDSEEI